MKNEYFICFIDRCKDKIIRNLAEYWYMELEWQVEGYEHFAIADDMEKALDKFYLSQFDHGILIDTRNDLEGDSTSNFVRALDDFLCGKETIIGDDNLLYVNKNNWNKISNPKPFNDSLMNHRYFLNDDDSVYKFIQKNMERKFYSLNTESLKYKDLNKNLNSMTTVASGINHLRIIKELGYTKNFTLTFCDWDKYALYLMKKLYEVWDGKNYLQFLRNCDVLDNRTHKEESRVGVEIFPNFYEWFNKFRDNVKVNYLHYDLLNIQYDSENRQLFKQNLTNQGNKLVWLSNIYCYRPTSIFKNLYHRCISQDMLMNDLRNVDDLQISYGPAINGWNGGWVMNPLLYKNASNHAKNLIQWIN